MKIFLFIIGAGIVLLFIVMFRAIWDIYMKRYRQKLKRMTNQELCKEADKFYGKITRFAAFFEYGQNCNRYEAVLDEMENRGMLEV